MHLKIGLRFLLSNFRLLDSIYYRLSSCDFSVGFNKSMQSLFCMNALHHYDDGVIFQFCVALNNLSQQLKQFSALVSLFYHKFHVRISNSYLSRRNILAYCNVINNCNKFDGANEVILTAVLCT